MDTYLLDLLVVLLYAIMIVYNGVKNATKETHFEYYAFGRNKLSSTSVAYSMITALIGANFIVGNLCAYSLGIGYLISSILGEVISFFLWGKLLASKKIASDKYLSICDIVEDLYGKKAAIISGIISTLSSLFSVALQLLLCCVFFEYCLGINKLVTCIALCVLMLFYVTFFGIDSITRTNVFQITTMVVVLPILLNMVLSDVGNIGDFFENAYVINDFNGLQNIDFFRMAVVIFSLGCCPPVIHRRFIASSGGQFYKAMKKTCCCIVIFQLFFVFLGMCCMYGYTGTVSFSGDVLISMIQKMPHFLKGVIFTGVISIVLSSVDAHTHTGVVACIYDVVRRLRGDANSYSDFLLKYSRIGIVIFLVIATFIAVIFGHIEFILQLRIFWCSAVVIPACLGMIMFSKPSTRSWSMNICVSLIVYIVLSFVYDFRNFFDKSCTENVIYACLVGLLGFFLVYIYDLHKKHNLVKFSKYIILRLYANYLKPKGEDLVAFILEKVKSCNYFRYTKRSFDRLGVNSSAFALVMGANIFFSAFVSVECEEDVYWASILIKFIVSVLVLVSIMYKYMPTYYLKNRGMFFIVTLMLCVPVYSFIFIGITNGETYWHIYTMVNMILLAFIIDWLNFVIILVTGFFIAEYVLHHILVMNVNLFYAIFCDFEIDVSYLLSICICLVVFYGKKFLTDHTNINAYKSSVGIISHETITPLMLINNKFKKVMKIDLTVTDVREKLNKLASDGILFVSSIFSFYDLFLKNIISFGGDSSKVKVIEVSAKMVIEHIMSLYPLNDTQKNIIKMELDDDFTIAVNVMLLKHIIHNIVRNALFFVSGNEKPCVSIRLEKHTYKSYNYIEISDNGVGMDSGTVDNIFQRFYTKRINGAGLGLYFCKNAMYSMMGDISVDSAVGRGSTFTLMFPHSDLVENVGKWDGDISSLC